jgi:peptide/nickel transport system substrate-binding protein
MPSHGNTAGKNRDEETVRRRRFMQAVTTSTVLGLAGCLGSSGNSGEGNGGGDTPKTTGDHLSVALRQSIVALDYTLAYDFTTNNVTNPVWDTLMEYTFGDPPKLEKAVATGVTQVSPTTYEYTLAEDRTFHNGESITATDVKASYERIRNPKMSSPLAWTLGNLKKGDAGIKAVDEHTVQFNLKRKSAVWQYMPALAGLAPKTALEKHGKDFGRKPGTTIGSGPLKVVHWRQGSEVKLKPFDAHPQVDQVPYKTITFEVVPEGAGRLTGLKTGELDVAITIQPQQWSQVNKQDVAEMESGITYLDNKLSFQNQKDPWHSNTKLKKALAYATNWDQIIKNIYYGHGEREKGPLPQNMKWHNDSLELYNYDKKKAKQLYEESGGIDRSIKFISSKGAGSRVAVLVQNAWKRQLGVEVDVVKMPYEQLLPVITEGDYDILYNGWGTDYPDPDGMLYAQYHSDNFPPQNNESWYKNETVDTLLVEARQSLDPNIREQKYKKAQKLIHDDAPCIWGMLVEKGFGVRNNIEFPPVTPMWYWQDIISSVEYTPN